jgi:hypothetical protein
MIYRISAHSNEEKIPETILMKLRPEGKASISQVIVGTMTLRSKEQSQLWLAQDKEGRRKTEADMHSA